MAGLSVGESGGIAGGIVARVVRGDNRREILLSVGSSGVSIRQISEGPALGGAFGSSLRREELRIEWEDVEAMRRALRTPGELGSALEEYFAGEAHSFSDLEDVLDRASVPYALTAWGDSTIIFRPRHSGC